MEKLTNTFKLMHINGQNTNEISKLDGENFIDHMHNLYPFLLYDPWFKCNLFSFKFKLLLYVFPGSSKKNMLFVLFVHEEKFYLNYSFHKNQVN